MGNTAAIILAAGEGKRMGSKDVNKVTLPLAGKPMIRHVVEKLTAMDVAPIVVVVGFAKESVETSLTGLPVIFAHQKEQLGTAHAVGTGLTLLPEQISEVLVIQGDDSAFYTDTILKNMFSKHATSGAAVTLLTIEMENPQGLGRVIRNSSGTVVRIVEEKDATEEDRQIMEINPACYVFQVRFLKQYVNKVEKSPITNEYYLTSLIDMALENHEKVEAVKAGKISWRGVNTQEELQEAEKLFDLPL